MKRVPCPICQDYRAHDGNISATVISSAATVFTLSSQHATFIEMNTNRKGGSHLEILFLKINFITNLLQQLSNICVKEVCFPVCFQH